MKNLSQEEWARAIEEDPDAVIVDVRTEDEWNDGIIPGAIMLDIYKPASFIDGISGLDKSKNYYIYCKAGARSLQACHIMEDAGIKHTNNLTGGIMQWQGKREFP
ncbi:MAG TPA: rhodanese-like domain-containing protein [Flavobacterium sp.]|jgi:rhodanese-related sulfurtransferase